MNSSNQVLINRSTLTGIANAIRNKTDSEATYKPSEMAGAINGIVGGGVGEVETLTIQNKQSLANVSMPANGTYEDHLLDIAITPVNAPQMTQVIVGNPEIASVIDNGDGTHSLRVRNGGDTTVTVTDYSGTISDSFEMHVEVALQDVYFPYTAVEVESGGSRQLKLTYKPHTATNKAISWSSSNELLQVSQSGLITATSPCHAVVSATSSALGKTANVNVESLAYDNNPDWAAIQAAVRAGNSAYGVGSEITMPWFDKSNNNKEYDFTWIVTHYGMVELKDGIEREGMFLMAKNSLPWAVNFENEKRIAVDLEESVAQEGVFYYGKNGSTYTALNLQLGDVIPHEMYEAIYKSGIDFSKSISSLTQSGLNWWAGSAIRQFLNSESDQAGFGFTPHHISDYNGSDNTSKRGFLSGVPSSFLDVITPVKMQTKRNTTVWSGEVDTTYDKVFLPSDVQLGFTNATTAGIEGEAWQYFTEMTSAEKTAALKVIPLGATSADSWWLRSFSSGAYYVRCVNSSGSLSHTSAYNSYRVVPACVIC